MFLKIVFPLFLTLLFSSAYSAEVSVQDGLKIYHLNFNTKEISFDGNEVDLSLTSKECNKKMVTRFSNQTLKMLNRAVKQKETAPNLLKITFKEKVFFISAQSPSGKFFQLVPQEIKRLKIEESLRCTNK